MSDRDTNLLDKALQRHQAGDLAEAEQLYQQILAGDPDQRDALNNYGILLRMQGRLDEAITTLAHATSTSPDFAAAFNSLGMALTRARRFDEALTALQKALSVDAAFVIAHLNIAVVFEQSGKIERATGAIRKYLSFKPDDPDALNRLGCYLIGLDQTTEALQTLTRSVELAPDRSDARINLAMVLERLGQYQEAVGMRRQALAITPDDIDCLGDLAISLERLERIEEAIEARRRVVELSPQDADSMGDLGRLLTENGFDEEAVEWFARALALAPDAPRIHFNNALYLLRRGEFEAGWAEHEWRLKFTSLTNLFPNHPQPYWDGSDLAGKTIFLHGEQGWGDTIQCARYVPLVARQAARVILGVRDPLARLMRCLPGIDLIITDPLDLPDFDVRCSLLSLPYIFKADPDTLPAATSYIQGPGNFPAQFNRDKLNIGIAWGGSPTHKSDHSRSLSLQQLKPVLTVEGCRFHSLQVDERRQEIEAEGLAGRLLDTGADLKDFADTADLITGLDLVISVDTSVVHLAGAMGIPVWVMLATPADWRWLRDRDDSPWYPSARLFRQSARGDWEPVINNVVMALESLAQS